MAASARTPLWKRLAIVLSAVVVGIVVASLIAQSGVSTVPTIVIGAAAMLIALFAAATLLGVRLTKGWR